MTTALETFKSEARLPKTSAYKLGIECGLRRYPEFLADDTDIADLLQPYARRALAAKPGHGPLCLTCETEFVRDTAPPMAFFFARPAGRQRTTGMLVGVCAVCAGKHSDDYLIRTGGAGVLGSDATFAPVADAHCAD